MMKAEPKWVRLARDPRFIPLMLLLIEGKTVRANRLAGKIHADGYSYRLIQRVVNGVVKHIEKVITPADPSSGGDGPVRQIEGKT